MPEFNVSNPENILNIDANRSEFSLIGLHLKGTIQQEAFRCTLKPYHALQLKSLLDTWLFQESGGKVGHMVWELRQFASSLAARSSEKLEGAERVGDLISDAVERSQEENIPPSEIALEISLILANFLELWAGSQKTTASMQ